jgi:hypothetical protein
MAIAVFINKAHKHIYNNHKVGNILMRLYRIPIINTGPARFQALHLFCKAQCLPRTAHLH